MVNVPATTANLGPGFDSFGFALDVWNRVMVQKSDKFEMVIEGEGKDRIQLTEDNLVVQCVQKVLQAAMMDVAPCALSELVTKRKSLDSRLRRAGLEVARQGYASAALRVSERGSPDPWYGLLVGSARRRPRCRPRAGR